MTKTTDMSLFKPQAPDAETRMDKTSRIVRQMGEDEAAEKQVKIDRLRKARLERDGINPTKPAS